MEETESRGDDEEIGEISEEGLGDNRWESFNDVTPEKLISSISYFTEILKKMSIIEKESVGRDLMCQFILLIFNNAEKVSCYARVGDFGILDLKARVVVFKMLLVLCTDCSANLKLLLKYLEQTFEAINFSSPTFERKPPEIPFTGLINLGMTNYLNCVVQQFFQITQFRKDVLNLRFNEIESDCQKYLLEFQRLFVNMEYTFRRDLRTSHFLKVCKDMEGNPVNRNEQRDADEFLLDFLYTTEDALKSTNDERLLERYFNGSLLYRTIVKGNVVSERTDDFQKFFVDIGNFHNLLESLQSVNDGEELTGHNQYRMDDGSLVDGVRQCFFCNLPPVLILCLKRFEYDYENLRYRRNCKNFRYPHTLDLRRFSSQKGRNEDEQDTNYFKYRLCGVIVQVGPTPNSGTTYSLVMDRTTGIWYRVDDSYVSEYDILNLEDDTFGGFREIKDGVTVIQRIPKNQTATHLFYERNQSDKEMNQSDEETEGEDITTVEQTLPNDVSLKNNTKTEEFSTLIASWKEKMESRQKRRMRASKISSPSIHPPEDMFEEVCSENSNILTKEILRDHSFSDFLYLLFQLCEPLNEVCLDLILTYTMNYHTLFSQIQYYTIMNSPEETRFNTYQKPVQLFFELLNKKIFVDEERNHCTLFMTQIVVKKNRLNRILFSREIPDVTAKQFFTLIISCFRVLAHSKEDQKTEAILVSFVDYLVPKLAQLCSSKKITRQHGPYNDRRRICEAVNLIYQLCKVADETFIVEHVIQKLGTIRHVILIITYTSPKRGQSDPFFMWIFPKNLVRACIQTICYLSSFCTTTIDDDHHNSCRMPSEDRKKLFDEKFLVAMIRSGVLQNTVRKVMIHLCTRNLDLSRIVAQQLMDCLPIEKDGRLLLEFDTEENVLERFSDLCNIEDEIAEDRVTVLTKILVRKCNDKMDKNNTTLQRNLEETLRKIRD